MFNDNLNLDNEGSYIPPANSAKPPINLNLDLAPSIQNTPFSDINLADDLNLSNDIINEFNTNTLELNNNGKVLLDVNVLNDILNKHFIAINGIKLITFIINKNVCYTYTLTGAYKTHHTVTCNSDDCFMFTMDYKIFQKCHNKTCNIELKDDSLLIWSEDFEFVVKNIVTNSTIEDILPLQLDIFNCDEINTSLFRSSTGTMCELLKTCKDNSSKIVVFSGEHIYIKTNYIQSYGVLPTKNKYYLKNDVCKIISKILSLYNSSVFTMCYNNYETELCISVGNTQIVLRTIDADVTMDIGKHKFANVFTFNIQSFKQQLNVVATEETKLMKLNITNQTPDGNVLATLITESVKHKATANMKLEWQNVSSLDETPIINYDYVLNTDILEIVLSSIKTKLGFITIMNHRFHLGMTDANLAIKTVMSTSSK